MEINFLETKINNLSNLIASRKALLKDKNEKLANLNTQLELQEIKLKLIEEGTEFLSKLSSDLREKVISRIEILVTKILHKVSDNDRYDFKVVIKPSKRLPGIDFYLYDKFHNIQVDIINSSGGGIADISSVILFFAFLQIHNPKSDYIIFDEVGKFISADMRKTFFELLKGLSKDYNKQILYISHQPEILEVADNIIKIESNAKGFSQIIQ